jgi:chromosome segregation ATPase
MTAGVFSKSKSPIAQATKKQRDLETRLSLLQRKLEPLNNDLSETNSKLDQSRTELNSQAMVVANTQKDTVAEEIAITKYQKLFTQFMQLTEKQSTLIKKITDINSELNSIIEEYSRTVARLNELRSPQLTYQPPTLTI